MQKLTEYQAKKLKDLGWDYITLTEQVNTNGYNVKRKSPLTLGRGRYTKKFGKVYFALLIRDFKIVKYQFTLVYQGEDLNFMEEAVLDIYKGLNELKALGYFENL